MTTRHQDLMDKSLNCIHLARAIGDRYEDPTKMTPQDADQRKALLDEASRLKTSAEIEKKQADLESWAAKPDGDGPVLEGIAATGHATAVKTDGENPMSAANSRLAMQRFAKALKKGVGALTLEEKAATLVEDSTGEIIVPPDLAGPIFKTLPHLGVFRGIGPTVRNTTSDRVSLRSLTGATAGWNKLETSGTVTAVTVNPPAADTISVWDLLSLSQVGVDELADTDANIVALVQDIIGQVFAEMEDNAFAFGSGTSQPWGIGARATSGLITQAVTGTNATILPDQLKSLPFQVPSRFRGSGVYMASNDAALAISTLKDSTSNYLWQPSNVAGAPSTLFGYRFYTLEGLPAMTATTTATDPSVMFGDVGNGYLLAQRQQITLQRLDERYADQGLVGFLFRMRVGGDVMRPAAFAKYLL